MKTGTGTSSENITEEVKPKPKPKRRSLSFADEKNHDAGPSGMGSNSQHPKLNNRKKSSGNSSGGAANKNNTGGTTANSKPDWYEDLTDTQINAFKEVFELLDRDGGGSIDATELYSVMKDLDLEVTPAEIDVVLKDLDKSGNGEIDFDEFLYAMTETANYLDILGKDQGGLDDDDNPEGYSRRQTIFFTAITKFAMKNSLGEIERYYANKAKYVPHVISHYTEGVRLIGLNDKQLEERLREMQKAFKDQDSPYAKTLPFVTLTRKKKVVKQKGRKKPAKNASSDSNKNNFNMVHPAGRTRRLALAPDTANMQFLKTLQELAERGSIVAKLPGVHLLPQVKDKLETGELNNEVGFLCSSNRRRRRMERQNCLGTVSEENPQQHNRSIKSAESRKNSAKARGWMIPRMEVGQTPMPVIPLKNSSKKIFTIDDVPQLREKASKALDCYYSKLRKEYVKTAWEHWDSLHTDEIPSEKLRENFREVYMAYSPHKEEDAFVICPWIPGRARFPRHPPKSPTPAVMQPSKPGFRGIRHAAVYRPHTVATMRTSTPPRPPSVTPDSRPQSVVS